MSSRRSITDQGIRILSAYQRLFETEDGRFVLHDLLLEGGILQCSLTPGDPHQTAYHEGRRSLALHVLEQLRWSEGEIIELSRQRAAARLDQASEES